MNASWSGWLKVLGTTFLGWLLPYLATHCTAIPVSAAIQSAICGILPLVSGLLTGLLHASTSPVGGLSTSAVK